MSSSTLLTVLLVVSSSFVSSAPTNKNSELLITGTKSELDQTGMPIYDFLIDYLERFLTILRTLRTGNPEPQISEIMPNGAGCADCDTVNALNPLSPFVKQMQNLVTTLNQYAQAISKQANRIAINGK